MEQIQRNLGEGNRAGDVSMPHAGSKRAEDSGGGTRDLNAFEREALPHLNDLFRIAARLTRDQATASDAAQETYLIAWKGFDRYQQGTNCRAWLFQILFNVVRHERQQSFKWMTGKEADVAADHLIAAEEVPTTLTDSGILAALDRLPLQYREVLLLVDVEEFTYKEASTVLEVPIGTVMSRLSRARALLREQVAGVAPCCR